MKIGVNYTVLLIHLFNWEKVLEKDLLMRRDDFRGEFEEVG